MAEEKVLIYEMPGRTEIIGNHTDHQRGRAIAAAINRYIYAEVKPRDDGQVIVDSVGHPVVRVDLGELEMREEERGNATALVRGVARYLSDRGYGLRGFEAKTKSGVPAGSGMSSSAAFEILSGRILLDLADKSGAEEKTGLSEALLLAKAGLYGEYEYYGKPSGLMDQIAIAVGEPVMIDFADAKQPIIESIHFNPKTYGYQICLVQTGASHADLGDDYAAIVRDMQAVAARFGKEVLQEVDPNEFNDRREQLIALFGERPVLRAEHFFGEQARVLQMRDAMQDGDMKRVLSLVNASGRSSMEKLQNIVPSNGDRTMEQAIELSDRVLGGAGATRVHGGGFAGTIQAYVPVDMTENYREEMESELGDGACLFVELVGKDEKE